MAASVNTPLVVLITTPVEGGATMGTVRVNQTSLSGATLPQVGAAGEKTVPVVGVAFWFVLLVVGQPAATVRAVAEQGWSFGGATGSYAQISKDPPFWMFASGHTLMYTVVPAGRPVLRR
jgi:hypothetical protein